MKSPSTSKHFNARQIIAVNRVGDCMILGDEVFPTFSGSGCVSELDRVLDYMPAGDLADLGTLLGVLSFFPKPIVWMLLHFLELSAKMPTPVGGILRLIRIGLKGLIMSLYYGNDKILEKLDYKVRVLPLSS